MESRFYTFCHQVMSGERKLQSRKTEKKMRGSIFHLLQLFLNLQTMGLYLIQTVKQI